MFLDKKRNYFGIAVLLYDISKMEATLKII
jgi:hypothetical protein